MSVPFRKPALFRLPAVFADKAARLWLMMMMLAVAAVARADALPESVDTDAPSDIMTLWVVGDVDVIAKGLNAVAMFFNGMGSGSPLVGLLVLGSVLALCAMLGQFITRRTMQPGNNFLMIVLVAAMFIPKTPVWIASYYDAGGGNSGGAVGFRKIDHVPVGVAYPLALFSYVSKKMTDIYDTGMQVLPDSSLTGPSTAAPQGGILTHGAEGYFSPLKTVLRLRNQFSGPDNTLLLANLANASQVCNWSDRWGDADKGGIFNVLARGRQSGVTNIALPGEKEGEPPVIGRVGCAQAGKIISLMMLKQVANFPGKEYSPTAVAASNSRNLSGVKGGTTDLAQRYKSVQEELDQLPSAMALAAGGNASRSTAAMGVNDPDVLLKMVRSEIEKGELQPSALAQAFTAYNAVNAAEIEANMVFSHIVQQCLGGNDANCARQAYMMTEARNRAAVDAAGEASLYQNFMGHGMNILMFIYIVMSPIVIFVVLVMGWGGIRVLGSYLLFAAWVNSWLPLNSAIAYYMLQSYNNRMRELIMTISASDNPLQVYSPAVIQNIFDGTQDMLASASTMMASTPLIMLSLLSGSVYGLVQLAQRANMVGKDYVDETKATPPLDQSEVIGMSRMIANSSAGGTLSMQNFNQNIMNNADATNPAAISLQTSQQSIDSARIAAAAKVQMMEGAMETRTLAQIDSDGKVTQTGIVYAQTVDGKDVARLAHTGEHAVSANEKFALGISGDKVVSIGSKGEISDTVTYKDSHGNSHDLTQGTSIGNTESIQTSFGTMNSHQLSSSISQSLSDAREQSHSIEQATSESVSHGFSTSINRTGFASLVSNDAVLAQQQLLAGATAARQYDAAAGSALQAASGSSSAYFNTLTDLSTGSASERAAALASIQGLAAANPAGHAQAYANMARGALAVQEQSHTMRTDNQAAIDQQISANQTGTVGSFQNPLDNKDQLEAANPQGRAFSSFGDPRNNNTLNDQNQKEGLTPAERQKILEYNHDKVAEMTEFNNNVMKEINDRPALQKFFDYTQADAWKAWRDAGEQLDKGDYGGAALGYLTSGLEAASLGTGRLFRDITGTQDTSPTGLSDTNDPELNAKIRQMEANQKMMSGFNMSDTTKTIDGKPIEEIIGRNPAIPETGSVPVTANTTDNNSTGVTLPTDRSGLIHLPRNEAFVGEKINGINTHKGTLAVAHAMEKLFDNNNQDVRFSAFNDRYHAEKRPNSLHTKGLAVDMVLDQEGKSVEALSTRHPNWEQAESRIHQFMHDNGLQKKDYFVDYEWKGKNGATGDHIHFQFNNQAAANHFVTLAESGQIKGLEAGTAPTNSQTSPPTFSSRSFTPEKAAEIARVAKNIGVNPNDLAAVISFETGGTFSTNARNPYSSGTGLIQFMDYTDGKKDGRYWGMTRDEFGKLSFEHQMGYVEKYFADRGFSSDKPQNIANLYTVVSGYGYKIGSEAYAKNKVWDTNKNGVIENGEMVEAAAFKAHRRIYF